MVYLSNWQEYQDAAEALYAASPNKARYVVKWKVSKQADAAAGGARGQLVLKITDDVTCLKYKTSSSIILNRFEVLNLELAKRMRNAAPPPVAVAPASAPAASVAAAQASADAEGTDVEQTGTPVQNSGVASGGVKKKKNKKKK
ncbi:signal recognition particle, SRP9/SRP14 subunit [Auriculariales sp. MPI-PUGE-AT-0066]|nr:signal recognition particle, SRP9/SRP14 subunit [Auriculariales sp. MPI-PUGE-AT-0066]